MTAEVLWWVAGLGAVVIALYVFLLIVAAKRDRWPP
jgi:hypothetical protein